jgi:hypothetical protein
MLVLRVAKESISPLPLTLKPRNILLSKDEAFYNLKIHSATNDFSDL